MSEPIMELVNDWCACHREEVRRGVELPEEKTLYEAIEREVAALREQLRIQDEANNILTKRLEEAKADVAALVSRKIGLEAERAALITAGRVAMQMEPGGFARMDRAFKIFEGKPGALAAWQAREGR